jgi:tryptophan-rich sensory protein
MVSRFKVVKMPSLKLVVNLAIPFIVGFVGSLFTSSSVITWFKEINSPSFTPLSWLFAPARPLIFLLMGLAFYFLWLNNFGPNRGLVIGIFVLHLILTCCGLFFSSV